MGPAHNAILLAPKPDGRIVAVTVTDTDTRNFNKVAQKMNKKEKNLTRATLAVW